MGEYTDVFPKMPDDWDKGLDAWIENEVGVWCCNSLNAVEGTNRILGNIEGEDVLVAKRLLLLNADMFRRAQEVIWYLFHENKSLKEGENGK